MNRMDGGQWSPASRLSYNLRDGISRCTVQVPGDILLFFEPKFLRLILEINTYKSPS